LNLGLFSGRVLRLTTLERWNEACEACGFAGSQQDYRLIVRGWSSWGRHYHTLAHLEACLQELDTARHLATHAGEVELSLWLHDAVYSTWRSDSEARSAALAATIMARGGAASAAIERVQAAILATRHRGAEPAGDAALVVDIDLSILGQPAAAYRDFEQNVRREYWWVPRQRYIRGRSAILGSFLSRATIYRFSDFRTRYESQARLNLASAIETLKS
jgi:predicted metal-dependent HD superfamily phosphohydrolase